MVAPLRLDAAAVAQGQCRAGRPQRGRAARPYTLQNYAAIFGNSLTLRWLLNSAIVALGTTAGVLILASLAGYGFARLDFPFRRTAVRLRPARPRDPEPGGDPAAAPAVRLAAPAQQLSGPDPAGPDRAVRRLLHDHLHARHPARARRSGDARRRVALDDLLEGDPAADDPGAVDARASSPSSARGTIIGGR